MTGQHTVKHMYSSCALQGLIENTDGRKVYEAIGYLSTWSPISYPICEITISGDEFEMTAVYYNAERDYTRRAVIGAVWHEDHFGFHS
jgi:hypothetical protein